jgi:branched-subunit amino acid aminotransferase/4-amino-4-deoxychorismate lyase
MLIETIAVRNGTAPLWELHMARMRLAATDLGLPAPDATAPEGGNDRILRLMLGRAGTSTKFRDPGSQGPVRLATVDILHRPYPRKTVERAIFDQALAEAQAAGDDEPLLLADGGFVAETARFAVVWEDREGRLSAPPLALGILPSIGRARLEELNGSIVERAIDRASLDGRPAALVNAVRGVVRIASLDGTEVPQSALLERLAERFWP